MLLNAFVSPDQEEMTCRLGGNDAGIMIATVAVGKIKCPKIRRGGNTGLSYPARTDGTARSFMLVPKRSQGQIDNNRHLEVGVDGTEVQGRHGLTHQSKGLWLSSA